MYKNFINSSRRNFNKIIGLNIFNILSLNFILRKDFSSLSTRNKTELKWILDKKDK